VAHMNFASARAINAQLNLLCPVYRWLPPERPELAEHDKELKPF
jgi:hypothetical protein